MPLTKNYKALAVLLVTIIFWSSAFAGIRAGLASFSPSHLALLRFMSASLILIIIAIVTKIPMPEKCDLPYIFIIGFIGMSSYHTLLNYGEQTVTAGSASLLIGSVPIITTILANIFLKERLKFFGWFGVLVSFCGIALISIGEGEGLRFDSGAFLVFLAALCSSIYFVAQKSLLKKYKPLHLTTYVIWAGTIFLFIFSPGLPSAISGAPISTTLSVIYLGVFPTAVSYVTWAYALSRSPASVVANFLNLVPVFAIAIAWLWLNEIPAILSLIGGLMAILGIIIVHYKGR